MSETARVAKLLKVSIDEAISYCEEIRKLSGLGASLHYAVIADHIAKNPARHSPQYIAQTINVKKPDLIKPYINQSKKDISTGIYVEKEIFNILMKVFNSANFQFLAFEDVYQRSQILGTFIIKGDLWHCLNTHNLFCDIEINREVKWGLQSWLPAKDRRKINRRDLVAMPIHTVAPLHIGEEIQRTLSVEGSEIKSGTLPLRGQDINNFRASMDGLQKENSIIELRYYGSEKFTCAITNSDNGNWSIKNVELIRWYKENSLQPGDKIWLVVESVNPLALRMYTEWDRDADTYRRYEQRRNINTLPYTDLSIRDIVYLFLKRTQKISHRSEISKAVLQERPEVSERSVDVRLGVDEYLFARFQRGYWGLKEWNMEQISITINPISSDSEILSGNGNTSILIVSIDYILANIAGEDLAYKILQSAKISLSASQICERISNYFGIDKNLLARTTFLNLADSRIVRLEDGTFILREYFEKTIDDFVTNEQEQNQPAPGSGVEIQNMSGELGSTVAHNEPNKAEITEEQYSLSDSFQEKPEQYFEPAGKLVKIKPIVTQIQVFWISLSALFTPIINFLDRLYRKLKPPREEE